MFHVSQVSRLNVFGCNTLGAVDASDLPRDGSADYAPLDRNGAEPQVFFFTKCWFTSLSGFFLLSRF